MNNEQVLEIIVQYMKTVSIDSDASSIKTFLDANCSETIDNKTMCSSKTLKGVQCKNKSRPGMDVCARHESSDTKSPRRVLSTTLCCFAISRGAKKGQACSKKCPEGESLCTAHLKCKTVKVVTSDSESDQESEHVHTESAIESDTQVEHVHGESCNHEDIPEETNMAVDSESDEELEI